MVTSVRARSEGAKAARRAEMVRVAHALWRAHRYEDITLQAVATRLGLTKAALYGYFPTKESLFLALYETLLGDFLADWQRHLTLGGTHTPASLAALSTALLRDHADLTRLMPHLAGLLERNLTPEGALAHKRWLLSRLEPLLPALVHALPALDTERALALLTYTQALVAGLYPMGDPAPAVQAALSEPALAPLCVAFWPSLEGALAALYTGLCA
ncbi:TetR/AcrR family transcriptional regulator [Deinococcus multiflagellatus]|uniref:TetR family transcriptional regulator n=1 Tax=Deinococcus multiflagellatus TaxID=1656887 RepID=A0ABW1ZIT5_9DEIO|nr:TetR/AcrR family transcriptional regulator [Deinococcus multiflagellatus]MBZ9714366.1 TetR/AcrR family transcriptional regulator [Deinococcus multiflagellatus]